MYNLSMFQERVVNQKDGGEALFTRAVRKKYPTVNASNFHPTWLDTFQTFSYIYWFNLFSLFPKTLRVLPFSR